MRRLLEPHPIVLASAAWKRERNIMTVGLHMRWGSSRRRWLSKITVSKYPTQQTMRGRPVHAGSGSGHRQLHRTHRPTRQQGVRATAGRMPLQFRVPVLRWRPGDEHGPFLWDVVKGPHCGRAQDSADRALPRQSRIHGVVTRSLTTQPLQIRTSARRREAIRAARFMRPGKSGGAKPSSLFCPWCRRWVGVLGCGCGCGSAGFGGVRWSQHGAGQSARRQRSLQAKLRCRGRDRRWSVRRG